MRVKSAIDSWFVAIILGTVALLLISAFVVPPADRFKALAAVLPVIAFLAWLVFGTYYELRDEYLFCRSGPFFERIPYDKIRSAKLTRNLLSSMALSSQRIEIRQHGKGYLAGTTMISPVNREEFLQELVRRCSNLDAGND